jgi:hypothetical protein
MILILYAIYVMNNRGEIFHGDELLLGEKA